MHWHIVAYPGRRIMAGPIADRRTADRVANWISIHSSAAQIHAKQCRHGEYCR